MGQSGGRSLRAALLGMCIALCVWAAASAAQTPRDEPIKPLGTPVATTLAASAVASTSAQLNGTVDPNDHATSYHFEYGTTTSYGSTTASLSAGNGTDAVPVSILVAGLQSSTTYHFRLVAENEVATGEGADMTFTTAPPAPPSAVTGQPFETGGTSGVCTATINPHGLPTTYYFEYGTTTSYGYSTPVASAGSGIDDDTFSAAITGLASSTTYHCRVRASSSAGDATGLDGNFTTGAAPTYPTAQTQDATSITGLSATLNGHLTTGHDDTTFQFEYGPTTSYGSITSPSVVPFSQPDADVSQTISLEPSTTYHFRLIAHNSIGAASTSESDHSFTTLDLPPSVTTDAPQGVTTTGGTCTGRVNPNNQSTQYRFEYGPTAAYGSATDWADAGSDFAQHTFSTTLTRGANAPLHCRIVARHDNTDSPTPVFGDDREFPTAPAATTTGASTVGSYKAVVNGVLNPHGLATTYHFEYGTTTAFGQRSADQTMPAGFAAAPVSAEIAGLDPARSYRVRLVATNALGTTNAGDTGFTTRAVAGPTATTTAPSQTTATTGRCNGTVNPNGQDTTYYFEYGKTTAYGASTPPQSAGFGTTAINVSAALASLSPSTTYHCRVVATNATATARGADMTFTTPAQPVPPPPATTTGTTSGSSTGTAAGTTTGTTTGTAGGSSTPRTGDGYSEAPTVAQLPPPRPGSSMNLQRAAGTVTIRLPGSGQTITLSAAAHVPLGSVIDTTNGQIQLYSSSDQNGGQQNGLFYGGVFKLGQMVSARPLTILAITGERFDDCSDYSSPGGATGLIGARSAKKAKKKRNPPKGHLWGKAKGRYRIKGRGSYATVRGTTWYVQDRCFSTRTVVRTGVVDVYDIARDKHVDVSAGQQYVAPYADDSR